MRLTVESGGMFTRFGRQVGDWQRAAGELVRWLGSFAMFDRIHQQGWMPREYGPGWIGAPWCRPRGGPHGSGPSSPAAPQRDMGLGLAVARWDIGVVLYAERLRVSAAATGPTGSGWLDDLGMWTQDADGEPATTWLSCLQRAAAGAHVPPDFRLGLVLGCSRLVQDLPTPPRLPGPGQKTVSSALAERVDQRDIEHRRASNLLELHAMVEDDPEWRAVGAPDCVFVPLGARGCTERLLLERRCAVGHVLSADGRSTSVDSTSPTLQLLTALHLLLLLRRGRAQDAAACRGAAAVPQPLQAAVVVVAFALPTEWLTRTLGNATKDARVWRATWAPHAPTGTVIAVERSQKLTVAEAAAVIAGHLQD